jgi:uncharacterized protein (TIGR00730 family)
MNRICVFCGSSMGNSVEFKQSAKKLGKYFVENKIDLVYGGANVGLMKIIADVAMEGGRKVTGIMPHLLIEKEVEHKGITELISVDTMSERKHLMAKMSDGFIAMPGGLGTLDELSEVLTYNQLRICDKPIGLLNTLGYYDSLMTFLDNGVTNGFIRKEHRDNIIVDDDVSSLIQKMNDYKPVVMGKWISDIKVESKN